MQTIDFYYSLFVFGILSHLSRAYRWKYLLAPLGYKPRFINSTLAVLIAYIANLGIPRSGEILRATTLSSYEKIPFEKNLWNNNRRTFGRSYYFTRIHPFSFEFCSLKLIWGNAERETNFQ